MSNPVFAHAIERFSTTPLAGVLAKRQVSTSLLDADSAIREFHRPTSVVVSRWHPGYRVSDLTGPGAEESLGLLLAADLNTNETLYGFQRTLTNPKVADRIINLLLPRYQQIVKRGDYRVSQTIVAETTKSVLAELGETRVSIVSAITHVMTRSLAHCELVLPTQDTKIVRYTPTFALTVEEMRNLVMVEAMRDLFSEAKLMEVKRRLNQNATPEVIAEVVGTMLKHTARAIPDIILRMKQVNMVQALIHRYYLDVRSLTEVMQAYTGLATLADYSNFSVYSASTPMADWITAENSDLKTAVDNVLMMLNSAPSIEIISLQRYAQYFGLTPGSAAGLYRGVVAWLPMNQTSQMDVVGAVDLSDGMLLNQQPVDYNPVARVADELNRSLLTPEAMKGLANLVADEMSEQDFTIGDAPSLWTIGVSDIDIQYLAMAYAKSLSFVMDTSVGPSQPRIIYAVHVAEQWIMNVGAANAGTAFFDDPAAVIVYHFGNVCESQTQEPIPLPTRPQSFNLATFVDTTMLGDVKQYLNGRVEEAFRARLPIDLRKQDGTISTLEITISALPVLLPPPTKDGRIPTVEGGEHYMSIIEPGVDRDCNLMLTLAAEYIVHGDQIQIDKAKSWLIVTLGMAMQQHAVVSLATEAINQAIVANKFDGRRLKSQYKDLTVMALFATLMGILSRFGKVRGDVAGELIANVPVSGLSVKAAVLLASMNVQLNASSFFNTRG